VEFYPPGQNPKLKWVVFPPVKGIIWENTKRENAMKRILFSFMCISLLFTACANENSQADKNVQLIQAAYDGNLPAVQTFLNVGADVNVRNRYGVTALIMAAFKGHTEIVKLLLENGADINTKRISPIILSRKLPKERADIDAAAMDSGATALIVAVMENRTETVKLLLEKGADLKAKDDFGRTSLIMSAGSHIDIVKLLLENGADVNDKDNTGQTALKAAKLVGRTDIVQLLEKAGAKE
jgi:ankyrin repeat protein